MSFAIHPEQEDFQNKFAKVYCAAKAKQFWAYPPLIANNQKSSRTTQRSNEQQINIKQSCGDCAN
jgi:hypothetical protein